MIHNAYTGKAPGHRQATARLGEVASQSSNQQQQSKIRCHSGDVLHFRRIARVPATEAVGAASLDVAAQQARVDAELALVATTHDI